MSNKNVLAVPSDFLVSSEIGIPKTNDLGWFFLLSIDIQCLVLPVVVLFAIFEHDTHSRERLVVRRLWV